MIPYKWDQNLDIEDTHSLRPPKSKIEFCTECKTVKTGLRALVILFSTPRMMFENKDIIFKKLNSFNMSRGLVTLGWR